MSQSMQSEQKADKLYEIEKNLYQIHALGNIYDVCGEHSETIKDIKLCAENVETTFSELGKIIKKLACDTLDIIKEIEKNPSKR